jgi:hypothetical protein
MSVTATPPLVPPIGHHRRDTIAEELQATLVETRAPALAAARPARSPHLSDDERASREVPWTTFDEWGAGPHMSHSEAWPPLPYAEWEPTKETLHRYTQIVGKIRMALVPFRNHWWHVTLLPDTSGLTTGPMPDGDRDVEIAFDLVEHRLRIATSDGQERVLELGRRPACADFYHELFAGLHDLGIDVDIHPEPYDLGDSPAFPADTINATYDTDAVSRFWRILSSTEHVLGQFASSFNGKASPIQLFWHSLDLAHARYSGRAAPGPANTDPVTAEAYSHEVIAFGFWPGDSRRTPYPAFYSYTAPEPERLTGEALSPAAAEWQNTGSGSLAVLPYDAVRTTADPGRTLLAFFESGYRAGATRAGWDMAAFETSPPA